MADPLHVLTTRLAPAFAALAGVEADPAVRASDRGGDFQANGALALGKRLGRNPREVAEEIVAAADLGAVCASVEVAGPGFINLTLSDAFLTGQLMEVAADVRLGVVAAAGERVVVDYSAPNVAKEMHVGHLRSTIIGDALVRVLSFLGDDVLRQNHIGDWGTPFGMLIEHLLDHGEDADALALGEFNRFYQAARIKFDTDEAFKERSQQRVVLLQAGDDQTLQLWQGLVNTSAGHFGTVYDRLGVLLQPADLAAESMYNDRLVPVVDELDAKGLLVESDGARCVFPPGFTNREGQPLPLIVQKADGGFGYAATDLAALRYRLQDLHATRLVYVVGAPQKDHLAMVFAVAAMAGWLQPPARAEHVAFGSILGADRRVMRTRAGESVRLVDLVDEAVERAQAAVAEKNPELDAATRAAVATAVGVGAVKYADLVNDRVKDYAFDWDRMLTFDGNTAPYLQYAHARIRSIFRRGGIDPAALAGATVTAAEPAERDLALALLAFEGAVRATAERLQPHRLCTYLFDLASSFTAFYEACPVLRAETDAVRTSRLVLCDLTARTLARGLDLLGIAAPDRM